MTAFQVDSVNSVQTRVSNPFGTSKVDFLESYQPGAQIQTQAIKEQEYKNLQQAEANYFLAGVGLRNSSAVTKFNALAQQKGYGNVNLTHRHDVFNAQ